jgi:hypothetical protein
LPQGARANGTLDLSAPGEMAFALAVFVADDLTERDAFIGERIEE